MNQANKKKKLSIIKVIGLLFLAVGVIGAALWIFNAQKQPDEKTLVKDLMAKVGSYPACPDDLEGILTAPLMEPKYIFFLTPLGNINPPGHTSPVDHIYFSTDYEGEIPLYAPADAWITEITALSTNDGTGKYTPNGYVLTYTVCDGLVLDFSEYTDLIPELKAELAKQPEPECKYGIVKPGHNIAGEGQCYYRMNYPVTSGEQIGYVQAVETDGRLSLPFEIWAANYNIPAREDVNWDYYNDNRYAHAFCLFDLYTGDLKEQFYQKIGGDNRSKKTEDNLPAFVPRTIEPLCGQVNQDLIGTIQGMWFGSSPVEKENIEFAGEGLAFLHNNIDPTYAEISIGGNFTGQAGVLTFLPMHSGTIDREPGEVMADGQIYCFNADSSWNINGKILVQLIDGHHLKVENQSGSCTADETFITPFNFQR